MLSEDNALSDWHMVLDERRAWDLSPEFVSEWVESNRQFFSAVEEYVAPGSRILELGCGTGRHALGLALRGYRVIGMDIEEGTLDQARRNALAVAPNSQIEFVLGDANNLRASLLNEDDLTAITHGGVMEHFPTIESIQDALRQQLDVAPVVIFDVPIRTPKNEQLFAKDSIFRHVWDASFWINEVLGGFNIAHASEENHPQFQMTDDLVVVLRANAPQ